MINGFNGGRGFSGHRDVSNVEQIELLKGPGSALYGRSEPGGTINIITRKPQFSSEGYVKVTSGSFEQHRVEGDYTRAVNDKVAVRVNGAMQDYGSFRDYVTSDKQIITPSVLYQINDSASLLYEFEYLKQKQLFDRGYVVLNNDFRTVPRSRYLGEPSDGPTAIEATGHQLTYQQQLSSNWSFNTGIGYRESELSGFSSDAELAAGRQSLYDDGVTLTRQRRYRDYHSKDTSVRAELSGEISLAGMTHNLLIGADAYDYELFTLLGRYRGAKGSYTININDPVYGVAVADTPTTLYANLENQQAVGVYVQDQIELTDRWRVLLGVRVDTYEQEIHEQLKDTFVKAKDTRISPRAGLVFVINPSVSLYSSYSEGFVPLSGTDYAGNAFKPELSESVEIGAKLNLANWALTLALFDAEKTNMLTTDPVNAGFSATLGAVKSRGVEVDLIGAINENLEAQLSYTYLDTGTAVDSLNIDWGVLVPAGSPISNVPDNSVSLMLKQHLRIYDRNATIGARVRYVSQRLGDTVNPDYQLPAYILASIFGSFTIGPRWKLEAVVDNVFDEVYVLNAYSPLWTQPGEPRSARISVRYDF